MAAGRLSCEHPLLTGPPRYDIDLLRCPLPYSTMRGLREAGLTKLSALAGLTPRDLLARNRLGARSVSDVLVLLDVFRHFAPAAQPVGGEPALSGLGEAVVNRRATAGSPNCWPIGFLGRVQSAFAASRWRWRTSCRTLPPQQASPIRSSHLNTSGGMVMAREHWKWRGPPWRDERAGPATRSTRETTALSGKFVDADPSQGVGSLPAIVSEAGRGDRRSFTAECALASQLPSLRPGYRREWLV